MNPESTNLLEEYKFCQEKVLTIDKQVWKTITIFGIGSFASIAILSKIEIIPVNLSPYFSVIIGLLAIGYLLTWWRIARRWWSIEQITLFRMREIEGEIGFRTNILIDCYDKYLKKNSEFCQSCPNINFKKLPKNYEYHGIQPVMEFFMWINISAWIIFILLQSIQNVVFQMNTDLIFIIVYMLITIVLFFKFYMKNE